MSRPNILLIITDQQRADTLGAYGSTLNATPTLDGLAAEGCRFDRAYCNNPLCACPLRASLLTGRYPSVHGVRANGVIARPDQPLLPELLAQAGYHTAAFGKVHYHPTGSDEPGGYWPEHRSFLKDGDLTQSYLGFHKIAIGCGHGSILPGLHAREMAAKFPGADAQQRLREPLEVPDPLLVDANKIQTYKTAVPVEDYTSTWVADRAVDHLQTVEEPFFTWCGIPDPHHPFTPPGEYWHRYAPSGMPSPARQEGELDDKPPHFRGFDEGAYREIDTDGFLLGRDPYLSEERIRIIQATYCGMVALVDHSMSRILDALRHRGLDERTIVLFMSDHGELLGDHGLVLKSPFHYQPSIRVPLLVRGPGIVPESRAIDGPVGLIDLYPTLLELARVDVPEGTQGRSLVPQLTGETDRGLDHAYVEQDVDPLDLRLRSLVTERHRLTHYAGESYGELYDLQEDPNEFVNLWDQDVALRREMQGRLLDVMADSQPWEPRKVSHA